MTPDATALVRAAQDAALIERAFLAGCEAFENKNPWATPRDLLEAYLESLEDSA